MIYLAIGCAVLFLVISARAPRLRLRAWRPATGVLAVVALAGAAYAAVRGAWELSVVLAVVGLGLAVSARRPPPPAAPGREPSPGLAEARSILGVGPEATEADIRAAHSRLMRTAHPDHGGTAGLAAQLNAARDRLLRRK